MPKLDPDTVNSEEAIAKACDCMVRANGETGSAKKQALAVEAAGWVLLAMILEERH